MNNNTAPFWQKKSLTEMTRDEWESLCDHCGKCCLVKLQGEDDSSNENNEESTSIYYTNAVCNLFNKNEGQCSDYANRLERVPSCVRFTQDNLEDLIYMPLSCAYRRLMEGRDLADWHHLISGDKNTIHQQKKSVLGRVVFEDEVDEEELEEHIVTWPLK